MCIRDRAMMPPWLYANGWEEAQKTLRDPAGREKVKGDMNRYWRFLAAGQWDRLLFVQPPYQPEIANTPFGELAERRGRAPDDLFLDILAEAPSLDAAQSILMQGTVFQEQTMIDSVVTDPIYMWQSDSFEMCIRDSPYTFRPVHLGKSARGERRAAGRDDRGSRQLRLLAAPCAERHPL